jgi:hypothetical protein
LNFGVGVKETVEEALDGGEGVEEHETLVAPRELFVDLLQEQRLLVLQTTDQDQLPFLLDELRRLLYFVC